MNAIQKKQLYLAALLGVLGLCAVVLLLWSVDDETPVKTVSPKQVDIATAGLRLSPQEIWVERMETKNKDLSSKLQTLEVLLTEHAKESLASHHKVRDLEEQLNHLPATVPHPSIQSEPKKPPKGIRKLTLNLKTSDSKKTVENTVPAGTFAKAVLLGGVDASTSIAAQSDPRPVLLRIMDHGNLPRKFKSDLKACHVLASSYGDLSSERVYMRLEKPTCTEKLTGEIMETQVAGYVLGEDGRTGIRGVVADRAGAVIRNSLIGGFFSGMGQFFTAQQQPAFSLTEAHSLKGHQLLSAGATSGTSNALEKYAEFFIKRAEQLQPVLQVAAGREVDIVFTEGTQFGETSVKKTLSKIREESRKRAIEKLQHTPDNKSWLPEGGNL